MKNRNVIIWFEQFLTRLKLIFCVMLCLPLILNAQEFFLDTNGVTVYCVGCQPGDQGEVGGEIYTAVNNSMLTSIVEEGEDDLSFICTTLVTDMSDLFSGASFLNGNIASWDVSNVTNMSQMFDGATSFNQNIGDWDVSSVTAMGAMFRGATNFNQDIGNWNLMSAIDLSGMFSGATSFNQDIGGWDVSNVEDFSAMFAGAIFDQDISNWDVSNAIYMYSMFVGSSFNQDIGGWDVANVTYFRSMFENATNFNQNLGAWDVSNGIYFNLMFYGATSFNQDIGSWDVSNAGNMAGMFQGASSFNQNIGNWDVSNVGAFPVFGGSFGGMFKNAVSFNQPLGEWDVSESYSFHEMFMGATNFNQSLCNWEVPFNIGGSYNAMFLNATSFAGDLSCWCIRFVYFEGNFSTNSNMPDQFLPNWAQTAWDCSEQCECSPCDTLGAPGCTSQSSCNYDPDALCDDGSCTYPDEDYLDCDGNCLNDTDDDGVCDELEVQGCTDLEACNYVAEATDDDGSCEYAEAFYDCNGNCMNLEEFVISGESNPLEGSIETYTYEDTPGSTYDWVVTGGFVVSGQGTNEISIQWDTPDSGSVVVVETNEVGCEGPSVTFVVTIQVYISVVEALTIQLDVWPNPANESLTVEPGIKGLFELQIRDATGREVFRTIINGRAVVPTSALSTGNYILRLTGTGAVATERFSVVR